MEGRVPLKFGVSSSVPSINNFFQFLRSLLKRVLQHQSVADIAKATLGTASSSSKADKGVKQESVQTAAVAAYKQEKAKAVSKSKTRKTVVKVKTESATKTTGGKTASSEGELRARLGMPPQCVEQTHSHISLRSRRSIEVLLRRMKELLEGLSPFHHRRLSVAKQYSNRPPPYAGYSHIISHFHTFHCVILSS